MVRRSLLSSFGLSFALLAACGDDGGGGEGAAAAGGAAGTGASDATGGGGASASPTKRLFLGPEVKGAFGSVAAADAMCASEASAAGLSGSFRALLGANHAEAFALFKGPGPFVAAGEGTVLFPSRDDIMTGAVASLEVNAAGDVIGAGEAWSGVNESCEGWTSASSSDSATVQSLTPSAGDGWLEVGARDCDSFIHLVCIEQ